MDEIKQFSYCVAIRTLGTAGEKYQQMLDSIKQQTIQPKKILVYIAEGYQIPKETIGTEEYIYVKKGMVSQRALSFREINTEYGLFLDDDVFLPSDAVEKLYKALRQEDGDCISPNLFPNHAMTKTQKMKAFFASLTYPRKSDNWAFKIQRNASYSYNNNPQKDVYLTESAAFACLLCKMDAYRAIHYEDEIWLDRFKYALGDDLLFYYKLFIHGYKVLIHYNSGIEHLDAGEGHVTGLIKYLYISELWFILWYRIKYNLSRNSDKEKMKYLISYVCKFLFVFIYYSLLSIYKMDFKILYYYIKGNVNGLRYINSKDYKMIPNYDLK